jgi:5-methylcytosine-specific restriction endonuclease McrA
MGKGDIVTKSGKPEGVEEQLPEWLRLTKVVKNRAAYQRGYNKAWKEARRVRLIEMLGGRCVRCGAAEGLEFDHIDPSTKVFAVCAGLSKAWDVLVEEASKTQLLCKPCHVAKGAEDRPELKHGTYHVYWYWNCRCDPCKAANARKSAALRAKRQSAMPATNGHGELVNSEFSVTAPENQEDPESVSAAQDLLPLPRQDSNLEPAG